MYSGVCWNSVREFIEVSLGSLLEFRSAICRNFVRKFVGVSFRLSRTLLAAGLAALLFDSGAPLVVPCVQYVAAAQLAADRGLLAAVVLHLEPQHRRPFEPFAEVSPLRDVLLDPFADEAAVVPCVFEGFHE